MPVRGTMANLITRVRNLINDPTGAGQIFDDQTIQDILDASRIDVINQPLQGQPTFSGSTIQYLDYFAPMGDFEDLPVLKQYLTQVVVPSVYENIVGHWQFATNVFPPVFITGKTYDVYRAAADLLERWSAKWMLSYDFTSDAQSFHRSQVAVQLQKLAATYRRQQRAISLNLSRSDLSSGGTHVNDPLRHTELDMMASG